MTNYFCASPNVHTRVGDIAVDTADNIYVTGTTASTNFPVRNAFRSTNSGINAFVTKIDPSMSGADSLIYSTYIGWVNSGLNSGNGIDVDVNGFAYVTGATSGDFPITSQAFRNRTGALDAYLTVLDPSKTGTASIVYSTLFGGSGFAGGGTVQGWQGGTDVAVTGVGQAYVTGWTRAHDFPVKDAFQTALAGSDCKTNICYDAFVARFDLTKAGEDSLVYSSFFGGDQDENKPGLFTPQADGRITADAAGNAYIVGHTRSTNLPVNPALAPLQATGGGSDAFIAKIGEQAIPRLIVGDDGGVWSTTDGGRTWADHNTNLAITQFYAGSVSALDPDFALGGSQDNGTEKWTGTADWQRIDEGDGGPSAISLANAEGWAFSSQRLNIARTVDALRTLPDRVDKNLFDASKSIDDMNRPFVGRFEKCPSSDDVFIAGTDNLWRTNNFFSGFNTLEDTEWSRNSPEWNSKISAMAFAPSDDSCNTYALGTEDGQLHITSDGGNSWRDLDPSGGVPTRWITDLAFDEFSAQTLYVTVSGFIQPADPPNLQAHVFKTTSALEATPAWAPAGPPVNIPHNTIVVDPTEPNQLFVGTDIGVWRSTDAGANWTHLGPATGMPNVAVLDLQIGRSTSQFVAFTHGRGAFRFAPDVSADLTLTKTDSADPVFAGDPITYTVTVKNNGPDTAPNVTVRDWLPPGMTPVAVSTTRGTCTGTSPIVCTIGDMANGASVIITIRVIARSDPGTVCNFARVSSPAVDLNPRDNEFTQCTTIPKEADLSVTKTDSPDPVNAGTNFTYRITVRNNGPKDASAVNVTDALPSDVTFVSATSSQGSCTGTSTVNCFFGNVLRGSTATATIVVKAPQSTGLLSNTATVSGNEEDRNSGNNSTTQLTSVVNPPVGIADLVVTKSDFPDPVQVNQTITYTVVVRNNNGPDVANGVVVNDTLPAGVTLVSATSTQGDCSGTNPLSCNIGSLVPGASATVSILVRATAPGVITNTVRVTAAEAEPDDSNNTAVVQTTVQGPTGTTSAGSTTTTSTTIPSGSPCDLDGDGQINVLDVQSSVNRLLSGGGEMDLNHDGRSDVLDLQILINVVLGTTSCPDGSTTTTSSAGTTTSTSFTTTTTATTTTTIPTSTSTTTTMTTTTTTSSSTTTTTTSISSTTTTTTPQPAACDLFGDDFNDGDAADWAFADAGTWQVVDGRLQVGSIGANAMAIAQNDLPVPTFSRLLVDVAVTAFDGTVYGFEPFSQTETFTLQLDTGPATIDGMGAAVYRDPADGILKAAFLVFDVNANTFLVLNATDYGAVTSLGIEWAGEGVTLIVNGVERQTIPPSALGQTTLPVPSLDLLWLLSTGSQTLMQFDHVCQSSLATTTTSKARRKSSLSGGIREELASKAGSGRLIQAHLPTRRLGN